MNAIIMAGGEGTRLKSVTGDLPKPMVPLCGRPLLEHILALLRRCGVREACLALRYRPEVIRDYFGDGTRFGVRLRYHVEERPLGTAGGVKACAALLGRRDALVLSGDCACDYDLRQLAEAHRRHGAAVTMALAAVEQPLRYGTVLTDPDGRVVSFIEKPDWPRVISDLVSTGIYAVSPEALDFVPADRPFDFAKDLFPRLMAAGREIRGVPMEGYWCDVGTPRAYYRCCLDALDGKLRLEGAVPPAPETSDRGSVPAGGVQRVLPCRSRARLMRAVSQTLMEAGADFSDGLVVKSGGGEVRIAPDAADEQIRITARAGDPAAAAALADRYAGLAKDLEQH